MAEKKPKDWSATQYLKFGSQRTRPVHDLVSQLPNLAAGARIVDLGCGPGNSTAVLKARFPDAEIVGMDSSPDMLEKARSTLPDVEFEIGDLATYEPPKKQKGEAEGEGEGVDLLFSNAVFHWLRTPQRIPTILRLLKTMRAGGVLAFQVPDNYFEPSHLAMRETASLPDKSWTPYLSPLLTGTKRPDLDPVESPAEFYDALIPQCESVEIWQTVYQHVLEGPRDIVEWVRGTGLQPFVNALPEDGGAREAFLEEYERRVGEVYGRLGDGRVMLRYPRLFVVAVRK